MQLLTAIALLAAAPADDMPNLPPTTQAAIVAGAQACFGATLEPDPRPGRFAGWTPATSEQRNTMKSDGIVVVRDNVMIAYQPGKDGGCVVLARSDAAFDAATFYPQLSAIVGASVVAGDKPAPVNLPDGEIFIPVLSKAAAAAAPTAPDVILVFANSAGKYAKKGN